MGGTECGREGGSNSRQVPGTSGDAAAAGTARAVGSTGVRGDRVGRPGFLRVPGREDALPLDVFCALSVTGPEWPRKTGEPPDDAVSTTPTTGPPTRATRCDTSLPPRTLAPSDATTTCGRPAGLLARVARIRWSDRSRHPGLSRRFRLTPATRASFRRARGVHPVETPPWPFFRLPLRIPSHRPGDESGVGSNEFTATAPGLDPDGACGRGTPPEASTPPRTDPGHDGPGRRSTT